MVDKAAAKKLTTAEYSEDLDTRRESKTEPLALHCSDHPATTLLVIYADGVLRVACRKCGIVVANVAVASRQETGTLQTYRREEQRRAFRKSRF